MPRQHSREPTYSIRGALVSLPALSLALIGCAPGQGIPPDPRPAYAHASCAPWDGGAVRIVLSEGTNAVRAMRGPPRPGLELAAYTGLEGALGGEFLVNADGRSGDRNTGGAVRCDERGECTSAIEGVIRLERLGPDSTLIGYYAVTFPNAGMMRGRFAARWLEDRPLCG